MPKTKKRASRYQKTIIHAKDNQLVIYASPKISDGLKAIMDEMSLYNGVKLVQIFEAIYKQGKKDGAEAAFSSIDNQISVAKKSVSHGKPGRPSKQ